MKMPWLLGILAVLLIWASALAVKPSWSMSMEDAQMLNQWRKEIVQLRYTEFCASITKPSPDMMQVLQQVIAQGKEAKHPVADEMERWLGNIIAKYNENGCGDV